MHVDGTGVGRIVSIGSVAKFVVEVAIREGLLTLSAVVCRAYHSGQICSNAGELSCKLYICNLVVLLDRAFS